LNFEHSGASTGSHSRKRTEKIYGIISFLSPMAVAAAEIVALEKTELIARVREHAVFGPLLKQLAYATSDARLLVDIIHAAECRLAAAPASLDSGRTA
jgi:hypothetical protein